MSSKTIEKSLAQRDTNIADLVFRYPDTAEILLDYGLHCVNCIASGFDTLEAGAKIHEMSDEEIDEMIERVNEVIEHGE